MNIEVAIQQFTSSLATAIVWGLGTAIGLTVVYVFITDYLRKRAEAQRKIWRHL